MLFHHRSLAPGTRRQALATVSGVTLLAFARVASADNAVVTPASGADIVLASANDSAVLDDVVVTAQRRAEPIQ